MAKSARRLVQRFGIEVETEGCPRDCFVIAVDVGSRNQLGACSSVEVHACIDHHSSRDGFEGAVLEVVDPDAPSTGWIVSRLFGGPRDEEEALLLLASVVYDTAGLRHADPWVVREVGEIMERFGIQLLDVYRLVEEELDFARKISVMKALQNLRFRTVSDIVVAGTIVPSNESHAARALLLLGADAAFVASQRKGGEVRLSARFSRRILSLGVTASEVLSVVAAELGCSSGGHPGAAGLTCVGDAEAVINAALAVTERLLKRALKH